MKRAWLVVVLLGLASTHASADNKRVWRGVLVGSAAVAVGGIFAFVHGGNVIDDSSRALCDGGAYNNDAAQIDPSCPTPDELERSGRPVLVHDEVTDLNVRGERGRLLSGVGSLAIVSGTALGAYAFYKGFIAKDEPESNLVIAPTVTRHGAGAALQLRW